ncbi:hypothetical protein CAI16_02950 [Virgibacillus dokdonensis]|uniref:Uncharacterized protein n=1 Tax=Virgibacillus dokdonensis TaxID=302167 RepID=A0A3E0WYS4_9BACI|nr:hypothetical protein [Virgibacillus dokdonensis]RFA37047.1 hypothetical protein CAI16_02950 [Virgibacillus dokdonensis]
MDLGYLLSFLAGISGSVITVVSSYLNKKAELKKETELAILDSAYKDFELRMKMSDELRKAGYEVAVYPWDLHVLAYKKIFQLYDKKNITEEDIKSLLEDVRKIRNIYDEEN